MGYRALLFCPDEKTAQTVTLVLNDLEFTVEACSEPFAAVKKLMGEHFDGVVVDCDNEQNASLLFKSARQSTSNQASLAVAVVEGQAGVAKAFRIGANLVLTKPINLEQAKGTLRVARGLLRKGEAAKPSAHAGSSPVASSNARAVSVSRDSSASIASSQISSSIPAVAKKATASPTGVNPWGGRVTVSSGQAASATAKDSSTSDFATNELPVKSESDSPVVTASASPAPVSSTAFSAMQQVAKKASAPPNPASLNLANSNLTNSNPANSNLVNSNPDAASASAPVRSPQSIPAAEPLLSKIARTAGTVETVVAPAEGDDAESSAIAISKSDAPPAIVKQPDSEISFPPKVANTESKAPQTSLVGAMSGGRKALLALVAIVLMAVAIYFGWAQLHGQTHSGSSVGMPTAPVASVKAQQPVIPNTSSGSTPVASSSPNSLNAAPSDAEPAQKVTQAPSSAQNESASASDSTDTVSATRGSGRVSTAASTAGTTAHTLIVRSGKPNAPKRAATDTAAPNVIVSQENSGESLPNLIDVSVKSTPVLQTLTISQGVSQGLIVKKVQPTYPNTALRLHLEGPVHLMATVGKSGNITTVKTLNGDPVLAQAAADAVKQWKYKPYLLNGEPVEIQTQVTINFKLPR